MKRVLIISDSWDQSSPTTGGEAVHRALHISSSEREEAR